MACDGCDRSRAMGYKFCIKCGQNFADEAMVPVHTAENKEGIFKESTLRQLVVPSMAVLVIAILTGLVIMLLDFNATLDYVKGEVVDIWVWLLTMFKLVKLTDAASQGFYVFLAVVLIASSVLVLWDSKEFFRPGEGYFDRIDRTPLFWLGLLFGAVLFLEIVLSGFFSLIGMGIEIPGGLLDMTLEEALFKLSEAAVWEELMFRMLLFGVPVTIVAIACREKGALRYLFGGFGSSKLTITFLIISSVLFALAHVDSWGVSKFFTVILGGFMLGYVYMRFGIHVAIVCHMINDFSMVWTLGAGGGFSGLLLLAILGLGALNLPLLFKKTVKGIRNVKNLPLTGFSVAEVDMSLEDAGSPPGAPEDALTENGLREEGEPEHQDDSQGPRTD